MTRRSRAEGTGLAESALIMTNERAAVKADAPMEQPISEIIPVRDELRAAAKEPVVDDDDLYANVACTD